MIRLVAVDMDGTLLNSRGEIPADFLGWVEDHPAIRTVIASGRQYYSLLRDFAPVQDRLAYIAENGGLVFAGGELLHRSPMDAPDVRLWLERLAPFTGIYPILCGVRSAYTAPAGEKLEEYARVFFPRLTIREDLAGCTGEDEIVKLAVYAPGCAPEIGPLLAKEGGAQSPVVSGLNWIDIANRNVNKGSALRVVRERWGIRREECMAFGDYMNDYELLEQCGESYAMGNACPEILALAKHVTASNEEDGVMRVLRML